MAAAAEPGPPTGDGTGLGRLASRSIAWQAMAFGTGRVLNLLVTAILARLLLPEDFGLVMGGVAFLAVTEVVLDLGVGAALVHEQGTGGRHREQHAFGLTLAITAAVTLIGLGLAPVVAAIYGSPESVDLFRLLALYPLARGAGQMQDAVLRRDLRFAPRFVTELARSITRAGIAIPMALAGAGAEALALAMVGGELAAAAVATGFVPRRPRLRWRASVSLLRFGLPFSGLKLVGVTWTNSDYVIVGVILGPTALGFYSIAYRVPEMLIASAYWVFATVAFPIYARARARGADLGAVVLRALRLLTLYGFTAAGLLAALSGDIVMVVFGSEWIPSTTAMAFISVALGLYSVGFASGDVFSAMGRPGYLLRVDLPAVGILVGLFVVAAPHGINAVAFVLIPFNVCFAIVRMAVTGFALRIRWTAFGTALAPSLACGAMAAAAAGLTSAALPTRAWALFPAVAAGAAAGYLTLRLTGAAVVEEVRASVTLALRRQDG